MDQQAEVTPKRNRSPYIFAVVYKDSDCVQVEECPSRADATDFVNKVGVANIVSVYKVSEVVKVKTVVRL